MTLVWIEGDEDDEGDEGDEYEEDGDDDDEEFDEDEEEEGKYLINSREANSLFFLLIKTKSQTRRELKSKWRTWTRSYISDSGNFVYWELISIYVDSKWKRNVCLLPFLVVVINKPNQITRKSFWPIKFVLKFRSPFKQAYLSLWAQWWPCKLFWMILWTIFSIIYAGLTKQEFISLSIR